MENGQPTLLHVVPPEKLPRHIAIIMDGNGRWAKRQGKPRLAGHEAGSETVRRLLGYCRDAGIAYLTLYAFSTENWSRPPDEVAGLMNLLGYFIRKNEAELLEKQVRLRVIGRREDLPEPLQADI
ncbi:MAG: di-trans,poly-cis-decaprenylcistransferase, partial [Kiritimatiellae bacterium]|nr:di-trans,poly-cis-decaprenylcistransferase [Kiritimatiellia bacterium]